MKLRSSWFALCAAVLIIVFFTLDRCTKSSELFTEDMIEEFELAPDLQAKLDTIHAEMQKRLLLKKQNDSLRLTLEHAESSTHFETKWIVVEKTTDDSSPIIEQDSVLIFRALPNVKDSVIVYYDTIRVYVYDTIQLAKEKKPWWKSSRSKSKF